MEGYEGTLVYLLTGLENVAEAVTELERIADQISACLCAGKISHDVFAHNHTVLSVEDLIQRIAVLISLIPEAVVSHPDGSVETMHDIQAQLDAPLAKIPALFRSDVDHIVASGKFTPRRTKTYARWFVGRYFNYLCFAETVEEASRRGTLQFLTRCARASSSGAAWLTPSILILHLMGRNISSHGIQGRFDIDDIVLISENYVEQTPWMNLTLNSSFMGFFSFRDWEPPLMPARSGRPKKERKATKIHLFEFLGYALFAIKMGYAPWATTKAKMAFTLLIEQIMDAGVELLRPEGPKNFDAEDSVYFRLALKWLGRPIMSAVARPWFSDDMPVSKLQAIAKGFVQGQHGSFL